MLVGEDCGDWGMCRLSVSDRKVGWLVGLQFGETALHLAAKSASACVVRVLLDQGASTEARSTVRNGETSTREGGVGLEKGNSMI